MIITIEINDSDVLALNNDLIDIEQWLQNAVTGKINSCKKRMLKEWQVKLMDDPLVKTIPATQEGFIATVVKRADYKNRADRETV